MAGAGAPDLYDGRAHQSIDVGAKYEIYELIIQMAKEGKTIIVVSSEMPEILGITNRIGVMSNGHLSGIVKHERDKPGRAFKAQCKISISRENVGYGEWK